MTNLLKNFLQKLRNRQTYRNTYNELSSLTDYELNDIGLSRGEIKYVAQSHYRDIVEENKAKERVYTYSNGNLKGWV